MGDKCHMCQIFLLYHLDWGVHLRRWVGDKEEHQDALPCTCHALYIFLVGSDPRVVRLSYDILMHDDVAPLHCVALSFHGVSTCCRAFGTL